MRIRTKIAKWIVGKDVKLHECPVCGKLESNTSDFMWHAKECAFMYAMKHNTPVPSFQRAQ